MSEVHEVLGAFPAVPAAVLRRALATRAGPSGRSPDGNLGESGWEEVDRSLLAAVSPQRQAVVEYHVDQDRAVSVTIRDAETGAVILRIPWPELERLGLDTGVLVDQRR